MKELVHGKLVDGLYQLHNISDSPKVLSIFKKLLIPIWHRRLGHIPYSVISKISSLFISPENCPAHCQVCPKAKQFHLPFNSSISQANLPFDLVHCDVWGPYKLPTCQGFKYFLKIVDDNIRAMWTVFIPTKQHVIQSIKDFYAHVHTHFHTSIKCIRSDNGGEFVNSDLLSFFNSNGVTHQTPYPYTPQQNGSVRS